jgi:hypothetical protein
MYQVNRQTNQINKLEQRSFAELNLREREHLQEWLAGRPDALGEDLLVIQKEFDGFLETRERLDLLALDKDGQLVVIENKLNDSGRDVTWQALKYTAYVSSLTKAQIVEIYQRYLNKQSVAADAAQMICDFLEIEELDEQVLNDGNGQRIFFVAAHFRKEVTSTVLWLRDHKIDARCFKIIPYLFNDSLFVDIQPVIPTPEAAHFMIGMAEKETEARGAHGEQKTRHRLRRDYWEQTLDALKEAGDTIYQNISPSKDHWLNAGSGLRSCHYTLIFAKTEIRVEFSFSRSSAEENKALFDALFAQRDVIENAFGSPLEWLRMDDKKASRIQFAFACNGYDKESWPEYTQWHIDHLRKLEKALSEPLTRLIAQSKSGRLG